MNDLHICPPVTHCRVYVLYVSYLSIPLCLYPSIPLSLISPSLYLSLLSEISSKASEKYPDMAPKQAPQTIQLHNANLGLGSTCLKTVRLLVLLQVWRKRLQFCNASCKFQNVLQSARGAAPREHTNNHEHRPAPHCVVPACHLSACAAICHRAG